MKMKTKSEVALVVLTVFVTLSFLFPIVFSANYAIVYELLNCPGGSIHYRLNVAPSESLLEYYVEKNHALFPTMISPSSLPLLL